jgi:hypothetical protein
MAMVGKWLGVLSGIVLLGAMLLSGPAVSAAQHEQVVFSGEAEGSFEVEFWIWCAVDESGNYDDCAGSVRFDDLQLVRHVEGEVTEPEEDVYRMDVSSTLDDAVSCTLTNSPPILHGPHNTVTVDCSSPSGSATGTDVVVVATG